MKCEEKLAQFIKDQEVTEANETLMGIWSKSESLNGEAAFSVHRSSQELKTFSHPEKGPEIQRVFSCEI